MKVYILDADVDRFRGIYSAEKRGRIEFRHRFNGNPIKHGWKGKERFRFVPANLPKGDTPGFSGSIPVFNRNAVNALSDMLEPNGELLPITCEGEDYFLFNVTRLVNALDEENCDLERFDDGRIMTIDHYSFFKERLRGEVVFKLPQKPLSWVYVTDPFVLKVNATGLRGFKFPLVWSSDQH
jgi:hypothetical protein